MPASVKGACIKARVSFTEEDMKSVRKCPTEAAEALGLEVGYSVEVKGELPDFGMRESFYAEGDMADWLIEARLGTYTLKLRILHGTFRHLLEEPVEEYYGLQVLEVLEGD